MTTIYPMTFSTETVENVSLKENFNDIKKTFKNYLKFVNFNFTIDDWKITFNLDSKIFKIPYRIVFPGSITNLYINGKNYSIDANNYIVETQENLLEKFPNLPFRNILIDGNPFIFFENGYFNIEISSFPFLLFKECKITKNHLNFIHNNFLCQASFNTNIFIEFEEELILTDFPFEYSIIPKEKIDLKTGIIKTNNNKFLNVNTQLFCASDNKKYITDLILFKQEEGYKIDSFSLEFFKETYNETKNYYITNNFALYYIAYFAKLTFLGDNKIIYNIPGIGEITFIFTFFTYKYKNSEFEYFVGKYNKKEYINDEILYDFVEKKFFNCPILTISNIKSPSVYNINNDYFKLNRYSENNRIRHGIKHFVIYK